MCNNPYTTLYHILFILEKIIHTYLLIKTLIHILLNFHSSVKYSFYYTNSTPTKLQILLSFNSILLNGSTTLSFLIFWGNTSGSRHLCPSLRQHDHTQVLQDSHITPPVP